MMVMLGGAWVPAFLFPQWLQKATFVVPTRWAIEGLDGMTWRGLGFDAAIGPIAALLGFASPCSPASRCGDSGGMDREAVTKDIAIPATPPPMCIELH